MKTNLKQRLLGGLLAFVMILGMMPVLTLPVYAAVDTNITLDEVVLPEGRPIKDKYISIVYTSDKKELLEKYPVGTEVSSWFTNLPTGVTTYIGDYYGDNKIQIMFAGIPVGSAPFYTYELEVPASFFAEDCCRNFV